MNYFIILFFFMQLNKNSIVDRTETIIITHFIEIILVVVSCVGSIPGRCFRSSMRREKVLYWDRKFPANMAEILL